MLEPTHQRKIGAYFGPLLRRVRVVSPIDIEDELEEHLSPEEFRDLLLVDLIVSGYPRQYPRYRLSVAGSRNFGCRRPL